MEWEHIILLNVIYSDTVEGMLSIPIIIWKQFQESCERYNVKTLPSTCHETNTNNCGLVGPAINYYLSKH